MNSYGTSFWLSTFEELCKEYHLGLLCNNDGRYECARFAYWIDWKLGQDYPVPIVAWEPPNIVGVFGSVYNKDHKPWLNTPMFTECPCVTILGENTSHRDIKSFKSVPPLAQTIDCDESLLRRYIETAIHEIKLHKDEIKEYLDKGIPFKIAQTHLVRYDGLETTI